jgi:hypothetical protein
MSDMGRNGSSMFCENILAILLHFSIQTAGLSAAPAQPLRVDLNESDLPCLIRNCLIGSDNFSSKTISLDSDHLVSASGLMAACRQPAAGEKTGLNNALA